jgi:hypothetical protein
MGRCVEKHFQEGSVELQIPPLRYASVGMTKGRVALPFGSDMADGETADPSASVGMTKGGAALSFRFDAADDKQQVPPLRFAPVGMTLLLGTDRRTHSSQQPPSMEASSFPLSSRAKPRDLRFNGPRLEKQTLFWTKLYDE